MAPSSDTETAPEASSATAAKAAAPDAPADSNESAGEGTLECSTCGENCWKTGWFLQAEEGEETRKSLCDDCFLICRNIKGADRCLRGKIKIIPKKEKKPKVAKKGTTAKAKK